MSLALLALLTLIVVGGLRFVVRAVAVTDSRREALEELTLGLSVLRGELQRAQPMMHKVGNRNLVLFEGLTDRVRFVNVEPPYLTGPPYLAYEYAVSFVGGVHRVELRRAPIDPDQLELTAVAWAEPRAILRLNRPVRFTYWGRLRPRDAPAWHEVWPAGTNLPEAVRLGEDEAPGWPELVVPLRINAPWYCSGSSSSSSGGDAIGEAGCPGVKSVGGGADQLVPSEAAQMPSNGDASATRSSHFRTSR